MSRSSCRHCSRLIRRSASMSAGRRRVRPTRRRSALNAVGRDALWMWRLLCRRNSSRSLAERVCPVACVARVRTDAISPIERLRWWGDIDSGDKAPCSRCDAASECRRSGGGGDGGMRPGDLVRPSSNPTYPCCISTQARQRTRCVYIYLLPLAI